MNLLKMTEALRGLYRRRNLRRGPRVVALGGGTGLPVLLRGLKEYTDNITAIVTVADDGGSSGRLRGEFGILPPGDIRNCLVALAETETLMDSLFSYRFDQGSGLQGHSLGNLLIAALADIAGDFQSAIREASKVLKVRGQVLPSTLCNVALNAELADGSLLCGESNIPHACAPVKRVFLTPEDCPAVPEAIAAIEQAELVLLGPGSLYTSVIPNLLVNDLARALIRCHALKCYVCNCMTQPGETDGFTASQHIKAIYDHVGGGWIDYCLVNTQRIASETREHYASEGAEPVVVDVENLEQIGVRVVAAELLDDSDLVRHDPRKLGRVAVSLAAGR